MTEFSSLDPDKIKPAPAQSSIGSEVIIHNTTSSTNDIAWEYAKNKDNDGIAIFAEQQTAGRGRAGNLWVSPSNQSVLCSIVLLECTCPAELLTLCSAVAAAEAIGKCSRDHAKIKWPNDIVIDHKKIAGILIESKPAKSGSDFVIGIGINCHQKTDDFPPELSLLATSIDIEAHTTCDRNTIAKRLLLSFDQWLKQAQNDAAAVVERWRELSVQLNQRVTLMYNNKQFTGNCVGIDPQQGLILQLDIGGVRMFHASQTYIVRPG